MSEVSAVRQRKPHNRIAGFCQRDISRHVRYRAGIGLHVGVVGLEKLCGPLLGDDFDEVGNLLALVIPFAGVSFCVFVGQAASACQHYRL